MIFFAILVCLCMVKMSQADVLTPEVRSKLIEIGQKCRMEVGTDMEVVLKIKEGIFIDDSKLKKQLLCMNKAFGIQKQNGDFNEAVMRAIFKNNGVDDEKADELIKKCLIKKDSPENSAFEMNKCIHSVIPPEEIESLFKKA